MTANAASDAFPIALQRDVQPLSIVRCKFRGFELVVWRDESGDIHVWEDRCPHRSVRLSAGRNLGDCIQGAYHGWKFGKDGSVVDIPAERHAVRTDIRVKAFPCAIMGGFVWTSDRSEVTPPRESIAVPEEAYVRPLYINAPASAARHASLEVPELRLWVTPCDNNLCLVIGYTTENPDTVHQANQRLNRLRRAIEAGDRP